MIFGIAVGIITGIVVEVFAPRRYAASTLVDSDEPPGRQVNLAGVHARMIQRLHPPPYFPEGSEAMRKHTILRTTPEGVLISTTSTNREDSRVIVEEAAGLFRGMDAEQRLAGNTSEIKPFTDEDREKMRQLERLRELLAMQAREEGFPDFLDLPHLAAGGSKEARMLLLGMTFSAKLEMFNRLSTDLGLGAAPGEPTTPAPAILVKAQSVKKPLIPSWAIWLSLFCKLAGLGLGLAGAFRFGYVFPEGARRRSGGSGRGLEHDW
jgi:hypothetical protein